MAASKMTTIAMTAIIVVVIVASVFGTIWSVRRSRHHQDEIRRSEDLRQLKDRVDDAEERAKKLETK